MTALTFGDVWRRLRAHVALTRKILEDGCENANRIEREHPELAKCPILWSGYVRAYLVKQLGAELTDDGNALERGFNLSTTLHCDALNVRVLKASLNRMPRADSPGRRRFFDQTPSMFTAEELAPITVVEPESGPNFILKWSTDERGMLSELKLGYPKPAPADAGEDWEHDWYWIESVLELTGFVEVDEPIEPLFGDIPGLEIIKEEADGDEGTGTDGEGGPQSR